MYAMPPSTLSDDALTEILLRLPSKSVLRSRAVCKDWRRITTCSFFVAAYSRRRPLELLLYPETSEDSLEMNALDAIPLAGDQGDGPGHRLLLRHHSRLDLFASCDGLLLFKEGKTNLAIFNPATRQWARLPRLTPEPCTSVEPGGFYFHRPSGEHRVLCFGQEMFAEDAIPVNYVMSIGGAADPHPRRLGPFDEDDLGFQYNLHYRYYHYERNNRHRGVAVGGSLYWPQGGGPDNLLAFDTVSETFRQIPLPNKVSSRLDLFDMHGTLGGSHMTCWIRPCLTVWALDDGERWSRRLYVMIPPALGRSLLSVSRVVAWFEEDVFVALACGWVVMFEAKGSNTARFVRKVYHGDHFRTDDFRCHVYRESLAPVGDMLRLGAREANKLIRFSTSAYEVLLCWLINLWHVILGKLWLALGVVWFPVHYVVDRVSQEFD